MISGIHISTSEMVVQTGDGKKKALPNFIKNQTLLAKVLGRSSDGMAKLLIQGRTVTAKTPLLLTPGQQVELKVMEDKDSVVLKLIGPVQKMTTGTLSSLVGFFSKNGPLPNAIGSKMAQVERLLGDLALKSDKSDKNFLPRLIEKSGMMLESKLGKIATSQQTVTQIKISIENLIKQDVKGNLLRETMVTDPARAETIKAVSSFIETIESLQLLNQNNSESGRFLLPFPVFNEGAFQFGQLLIDRGDLSKKGDNDADKLIRMSFLLNMTRLGALRADFSVLNNKISGQFLLEDDETCQYVRSMIGDLKKRLNAIEYTVLQLECHTAQKKEIEENYLMESLMKESDEQVLNIVI